MQIEFMWKTDSSGIENCPAMYRAPGGYVVQGKTLDSETRARLRQLGDDEDAVFVPADVVEKIRSL
jgi:hypothetical protein